MGVNLENNRCYSYPEPRFRMMPIGVGGGGGVGHVGGWVGVIQGVEWAVKIFTE